MARTITQIQQSIIDNVQGNATLGPLLTSTSSTAVWRLMTYIFAAAAWVLESLWDLYKADVNETIAALKPHSLRWYAGKAKAFQYGYSLVAESDYYDNSSLTEAQIAASKIVSYAAVVEQQRGIRIKVAKTSGSDLTALSGGELSSFTSYMERVKDAGVKLLITSSAADSLKLTLLVKYDPLILTNTGARIDGASLTPVADAVKNYLKNLPFNGVLSAMKLIDAIQAVEGVKDLRVDLLQAKYAALPFTNINIDYTPDAGYLRIADNADLVITYVAG